MFDPTSESFGPSGHVGHVERHIVGLGQHIEIDVVEFEQIVHAKLA
jgi:hypothetical protein